MQTSSMEPGSAREPAAWWAGAFRDIPTASDALGHPCGAGEMLIVVAYDITDPKRLPRVAKYCEDYGVRVQYSVFECRLAKELFEAFWSGLKELMDLEADRAVAYRICESCAAGILIAGRMECTGEAPDAYIL